MLNARPVSGRFRRWRHAANAILIAILCGIPWVRIAGEPLVLLDVPARKFHVLGLVIFPQELYFLWLLLATLALALFFFTALAGRLWCGWACPQTVFTDVFAALARRIEGWRGSKRPARVAFWRSALLHACWALISAAIGFHLVGYFVSPYTLIERIGAGQLGGAGFAFLGVAGALAYVNFVFVRQTFCKFLCPYARFQSVLFDRDTLVIGYDTRRGEPRGKRSTTTGDCVDCRLCVQVCPSDIDIRQGLQLECIACTQCIDACDGVMDRLARRRGLIAYRALAAFESLRAPRLVRPRLGVYAALLLVVATSFGIALSRRVPMELMVEHNRDALFTRAADGRVGNAFTLHIENRARTSERFHLRIESEPAGFELIAGLNPIPLAAISMTTARVFVMAPHPGIAEAELRFFLEPERTPGAALMRETHFIAPPGGAAGGR